MVARAGVFISWPLCPIKGWAGSGCSGENERAKGQHMYAAMKTLSEATNEAAVRVIDLRSDTVTRPSRGMRNAAVAAKLGDDVYGEDPTVNALEEKVADLLGKEKALFLPTGTQSNLCALLAHCQRGDEYIVGDTYHIYQDEAGGPSVLGGVAACAVPTDGRGGLHAASVAAAIKPDDSHYASTRLVCLENTVHGRIQYRQAMGEIGQLARSRGLGVHLDGARIMNASVASGVPPSDLAESADTVSVCLSKGLGAPAGSVLCGPEHLIRKARRARKLLGGAMRQSGLLAACGLYALDHNVTRLKEDHLRARHLATALTTIPRLAVNVSETETNMVFIAPHAGDHDALIAHLRRSGILVGAQKPNMRLVTHLDVNDDDIETVIASFTSFYAR